jgi:serine/threonine protein kinase
MHNKIINGYTLLRFLGKGGMAEVWYAENKLGKPAAIKIMLPKYVGEEQVILRFESEAKAMVVLDHPNIRKVFDFGEVDSRPFIIMEYLEGSDLATFIQNKKKPNNEQLKIWWQQALNALQNTHNKGIIHRDIKPSNIFLCNDGNIKLLDFGIAKVKDSVISTHTGSRLGSLQYMSPEQIIDPKRVQPNTDIFSLAVSFVHLLKGKIPYVETDSDFKLQSQIVNGELDLKGISTEWLTILQPCLQKDPKLRIQTANEALNNFTKNTDTNGDTKIDFTENSDYTKYEDMLSKPSTVKPKPKIPYKYLAVISTLILFALALFYSSKKNGQYNDDEVQAIPPKLKIELENKYLYIGDSIRGNRILVRDNALKFGFIDRTGKEVIPFKYDASHSFGREGLASVELNNKWGFIDNTGNEVIPLKYDYAYNFSKLGLGLASVKLNDKWGFIDKNGKVVIPFKYDDADGFLDGLAVVKLNYKFGFVDKTGKEVIPLKYDDVRDFSEGLAPVQLNDKWGYIDKTGNEAIPFKYDDAFNFFSEGLANVKLNDKNGFIDKTGKEVIPLKYDNAGSFISQGLAPVKSNDKWGFIDKTGNEVIPLKYDYVYRFNNDGLTEIKLNNKWGFIDKTGKEVIPLIYDGTNGFVEGLASVKLNDKWGFIDKTGKEVIPFKYDDASGFIYGLARVKLNDSVFYINKKGECVKDCPILKK